MICAACLFLFLLSVKSNAIAADPAEEEKLLAEVDRLLFTEGFKILPATISLDTGWDSEGGKNYFASVNLPVFEKRLLMSGGKSSSVNPETDEEETSTSYAIGIYSDAREKLGLGVEYQSWKFEDIITINTLQGTIALNYPAVIFSLTPVYRNIAISGTFRTVFGPREFDVHIDSYGYRSGLIINLPAGTWLSGTYASHSYDDEIFFVGTSYSFFDLIERENFLLRLSPGVQENTYGLEKLRYGGSAGIDLDNTGVSIGWSESTSAVDGEKTATTSASLYWLPEKNWMLRLSGGVQDNTSNSDTVSFGTISLKYSFQ